MFQFFRFFHLVLIIKQRNHECNYATSFHLLCNLELEFGRAAHEAGAATAIVNVGNTRADDFVSLKINARCGEVCFSEINLAAGSTCCYVTLSLLTLGCLELFLQILPRLLDIGCLSIPVI